MEADNQVMVAYRPWQWQAMAGNGRVGGEESWQAIGHQYRSDEMLMFVSKKTLNNAKY